jgi:hypothetical protein
MSIEVPFKKVAQTVAEPKKAKISSPKLYSKSNTLTSNHL